MHAAEANSSDPGGSSSFTPWRDGSVITLPSPTQAAIHRALALTRQQQDALAQLAEVLSHLAHLADQCRQSDTPNSERQLLDRHFHERAGQLGAFGTMSLEGELIFSRKNWTVDLVPRGNKLVIPGVYRSAEQSQLLQQADLLSHRSGTETHQRILEILEWVVIDQALVTEIQSRLNFAALAGQILDLARP